jgi:2-desacetyl-2-hydroxyethyl bacteriochlorophyllide A dehydrogenase
MKAAVFRGAGRPLAIETVADPVPGPSDVIIKVQRCGICGTDLHMTSGHGWDFPIGTIPGHEYSGEIVEVGSQVRDHRKGALITALPSQGCGHCKACARGNLALCHNAGGVMGGFGEYLRVPTASAVALPSSFSAADGALVEPFAVGLHGVRSAQVRPGERVLVLGAGSVALTVIFWAKRLGAGRVIVASRSPRRQSLASEMGADAFIQSGSDERERVVEAFAGAAPEVVFECVGAPGILTAAINHADMFGRVLSMGFCTAPDTLIPAAAGWKGVQLSFPVGYSLRDFRYAADTMMIGPTDPAKLITSVRPLSELPRVFEALRGANAETKVHVSFEGS